MRPARTFFIAVLLLCTFETVRLWYLSPAEMASHFNAQGFPDNFVPKSQVFMSQMKTGLFVVLFSLAAQLLLVHVPVNMINLPNREFWLSPERRDATLNRLSSFVDVLFAAILLVMQAAFELVVSANLYKQILFPARLMVLVIIVFFIFTFLMLLWLFRSFRLPS